MDLEYTRYYDRKKIDQFVHPVKDRVKRGRLLF